MKRKATSPPNVAETRSRASGSLVSAESQAWLDMKAERLKAEIELNRELRLMSTPELRALIRELQERSR